MQKKHRHEAIAAQINSRGGKSIGGRVSKLSVNTDLPE